MLIQALPSFCQECLAFALSEQMGTTTPTGKTTFTVLGAVAELERSLIVERVKAGLRNAKAKGKRLGRPKKILDAKRIAWLRGARSGVEADRRWNGSWGRNDLSRRPGGLQGSGKTLTGRRLVPHKVKYVRIITDRTITIYVTSYVDTS